MDKYKIAMGRFITRVSSETKFISATIGIEPCSGDTLLPVLRPLGSLATGIQIPFNKLEDSEFIDAIIYTLISIEDEART